MNIEIVSLAANLGVLSVAGILYTAYIKNLRSTIGLKDTQVKTAEQNVKLWKDRAHQLERQTPEYIERVLADRIRVREDEIERLRDDTETHQSEIERKDGEVRELTSQLEAARAFPSGRTVWDRERGDFRQAAAGELEVKNITDVWVDSATLMICDPWHLYQPRERQLEDFPIGVFLENDRTGERVMIDEREYLEEEYIPEVWKTLPTPEPPVDPDTYVQAEQAHRVPVVGATKELTFINGMPGAGVAINTGADGSYHVSAEMFQDRITRVIIDFA